MQNRKIINKLKSLDVLRLVCEKHKDYYSEYYCTQCDQIVCYVCSQLDHQSHNGGKLHKVNPENFREYLNYINPLLDKQLELITNLKIKLNNHISQAQILSSSDFISMLNNTKLLLKDFVKQEELNKLSITHYKLNGQEQPQEEIIEQIEIQAFGRQKLQKYENPSDQDKVSAEHYNSFLQLVNNELQKSKSSIISTHMKDWNKAEFKLLYQGSRDGFETSKFHQLCDNQGPTIAFVLSEFGKTFGGYTSVPWTSDGSAYKEDRQSFLFQLNQRTVHPIEKNFQYALYHGPGQMTAFGGGHDFVLYNQCDANKSSYSKFGYAYKLPPGYTYDTNDANKYLTGEYNFKVLEIEVYSVQIN
eukprot:403341177